MSHTPLDREIAFIVEIDKLKHVLRQTMLMDKSRYENDAEHSWHLAVMAMLLQGYSAAPVDLLKVVKMVLVHDLVEIDAGDTFCYDEEAALTKAVREQQAANRIFGLLPPEQAEEIRALWEEFEARRTPEAKFAAALDRLQPLLHNYNTQGAAWRKHGVTLDKVLERNKHMAEGAPALWEYAKRFILDAAERGWLPRG